MDADIVKEVQAMNETILVALIGLAGSGAGAFGGILVSSDRKSVV